jgi:hypothetical protein
MELESVFPLHLKDWHFFSLKPYSQALHKISPNFQALFLIPLRSFYIDEDFIILQKVLFLFLKKVAHPSVKGQLIAKTL